mgnify:CR=1 FL=1
MGNVTIQKRGKYYQYKFAVAKVDGKRKFVNKSGFETKEEAIKAGNIAFAEYLNTGLSFKEKTISFSDYLDYWYENYCETTLKYNTRRTYKTIMDKYLKAELGKYRLSALTSDAKLEKSQRKACGFAKKCVPLHPLSTKNEVRGQNEESSLKDLHRQKKK